MHELRKVGMREGGKKEGKNGRRKTSDSERLDERGNERKVVKGET